MNTSVTPVRYLRILFAMILMPVLLSAQTIGQSGRDPGGSVPDARRLIQQTSVKFTENRGQIVDSDGKLRPDILYRAAANGVTLYFTKGGISYVFSRLDGDIDGHLGDACRHSLHGEDEHEEGAPPVMHMFRTDLAFIGASAEVKVTADEPTADYDNYYLGHCRDGITGVRSFRSLTYHDVYANIDLVVRATEQGVKYDFIVRPGGNVSDIRFRYDAADQAKLLRDGSLRVVTPLGYLQESTPYTYQETAGGREKTIASSYRIDAGVIGFRVGTYDTRKPLVIDPTQIWATYCGGTSYERLNGGDPTEVDREGNVMIVGYTISSMFPVSPGAFQQIYGGGFSFGDVFLVKYNGRGVRQWATFYGGSSDEIGHGVSSDKHGNVFITGHTSSTQTSFPITSGAYQTSYGGGDRDAFVAKFTPTGGLLWSTYVGLSSTDDGYGFAVDSNDNVAALVTTFDNGTDDLATSGAWDPTHNGNYDVLIIKFNATGQRLWATYFGGSGEEFGYAAASDIDDNIIFTGWTNSGSSSFPETSGAYQTSLAGGFDAFVAKFGSAGELRWATYYGGSSTENKGAFGITDGGSQGYCGITTDGAKNVLITGVTNSSNFPVTDVFQETYRGGAADAFIVKFDENGVRQWATFVGGSGRDVGVGVAANPRGGVLITGITNSIPPSFPVTSPPDGDLAFQSTYQGGAHDAFIVKLSKDGEQQWGTYFGGPFEDQGHGISFNPYGFIIIGGYTFSQSSFPFVLGRSPLEPPQQPGNAGQSDAFISVFCDPVPPEIDTSGPTTFCHDQDLTMSIDPEGYIQIAWYKAPETTPFSTLSSVTVNETGDYYLKVESAGGCPAQSDTIHVKKLEKLNPVIPADPHSFCTGDSITLSVTGGPYFKHTWHRDGVLISGATTSTLKVKQGGTYKVVVEDKWGCKDSTQLAVSEYPKPAAISVTPADTTVICEGESVQLTANGGSGGTMEWSNGAGGSTLTVTQQGEYFAKSVNAGTGCSSMSNKVFVKVNPKPVIGIAPLLPLEFCDGDSTVLAASRNDYVKYVWSTGEQTKQITIKKSGTITLTVTDDKGCTNKAEVQVTVYERPKPKITQTGPITRCEGDSVMLSLDGGSFTTVLWSNGTLGFTTKVGKTGAYYAIVTGPGGCRAISDTIQVNFIPRPDARISGPEAVCINSSGSYSVPDQPGVTYQWQVTGAGASIMSGAGTSGIDVNWGPTGKGTITVTVTHTATGCKATGTLTVDVGSALVPTIVVRPGLSICPGDSAVLDAGPNYSSYRWTNGATTRTITVKEAGVYRVTVENAGGCSGASQPVTITISQPPVPVIVADRPTTLCLGDTVYLSVSEQFNDYLWSGGQTIDRIAVWQPGSYTVTVVDANGCQGTSAPIEVRVATPPKPVISGPNSVCINSTQVYAVASVPGDSYAWTVTGGQISGPANGPSIAVEWPTAGSGLVQVRQIAGATGCMDSARYDVTVGTSLQPVITTDGSTLICQGDSILLSAPDGYASYLWSSGASVQSIYVSQPGTYAVTVTDAGGCSGSGEITVSQKPALAPKVVPDGRPGLCSGDSLRLEATPGFARYLWSTGETTQSIWVKKSGSYTVTVFDADSCSDVSATVEVITYPLISTPIIEAVGDSMVAIVDTVDSPKPMIYRWKVDGAEIPGATGKKHYAEVVGSYTVTVIDSNGCSAESLPFTPIAAGSATVGMPIIEAAPGDRVKIPVTLHASQNLDRNRVEHFEGELRFDRSLLILADPRFTSTVDGDQQVVKINGRRALQQESGDLLVIDFIAALGDKTTTPLELRVFNWMDGLGGATATTIQQGQFNLIDICETGGRRLLNTSGSVGIKAVRPNPFATAAEIEYEVNEHGYTQLFIVDMLGRRVATLVDGDVVPGSYAVQLDASQLASGSYFCILQTPTLRLHRPLQVEK